MRLPEQECSGHAEGAARHTMPDPTNRAARHTMYDPTNRASRHTMQDPTNRAARHTMPDPFLNKILCPALCIPREPRRDPSNRRLNEHGI